MARRKAKYDRGGYETTYRLIDMPETDDQNYKYDQTNEFINLLFHALKITDDKGAPVAYPKARFIKKSLIFRNRIGYKSAGDIFANVNPAGKDAYGFPSEITLFTDTGETFDAVAPATEPNSTGTYIIYGFPYPATLAEMVENSADTLTNIDNAIRQNFNAARKNKIIVCRDKDTRLSVDAALQRTEDGESCVVLDKAVADKIELLDISADFIVPLQAEYGKQQLDRLFNKIGIMSANTDKRERVQSAEVNATVGQCLDYINMLIENVNEQFETYGIPYRLKNNTSTAVIYGGMTEEQNGTEFDGTEENTEEREDNETN